MDFSDKELKVLLQSLYRLRGEVSGASQSEQNRLELVVSVIDKIESKVGPLKAVRTGFDREMDASLAILKTGKMGLSKGTKAVPDLDKTADSLKVKTSVTKAKTKKASDQTKKSGATKKRS